MRHRNVRVRAALGGAVLILALGTAQAATVAPSPQPKSSQPLSLRLRRGHDTGFAGGVLSFFRFAASVVAPAPQLPSTLPTTTEPRPALMGKTDDSVVTYTGRRMTDDSNPI